VVGIEEERERVFTSWPPKRDSMNCKSRDAIVDYIIYQVYSTDFLFAGSRVVASNLIPQPVHAQVFNIAANADVAKVSESIESILMVCMKRRLEL
jgi:hypothetical protein